MELTENEKYLLIKLHCKIEQVKNFVAQGFVFDLEAFLLTMEIEGIKKEMAEKSIKELTIKKYIKILKHRIIITKKGYDFIKNIVIK